MAVELQKLTTQLQSIGKKIGVREPLTGSLAKKFMEQLSPTELALLFPDYYKSDLPDVSGFRSLSSGKQDDSTQSATPTGSGTGRGGGGGGGWGGDTADPTSPIAEIFQKYGVKLRGEGKPGQYRPEYKISTNDLDPDVINTIAGEALAGNKESVDAVINNMFNRIGAQKNWKDLKSVARDPGQYTGYRVASEKDAAFIRKRIEAIASGRVPSNIGRATEFRAANYVFGEGRGKTFERSAKEQGYLQPAGSKDNVYAETFLAGPFAPFREPPPQSENQTAMQLHKFGIKDWDSVPKSVRKKIGDEIIKYQKPGVVINFDSTTGEIDTSMPETEFRRMVDEKTPTVYKMFMNPNEYLDYQGTIDIVPQQTTPSADAVVAPEVEQFLKDNPQIIEDAKRYNIDINDLKQKLADPKMREEMAGEYKLASQNRKSISDQKVTISEDVMRGKAPYIEGDDFAVPVYLKRTTSEGFDESVEGMSPEAIQQLKASAIAAKAAGLDKLEVTGALADTGHKSHSEGTEFDFKGYKDGKMWNKDQRALTVLGAVQQGADRAGFYPGGGVHIGKSGQNRPKAAWGPTGTEGVSLASFTPGLERDVAAYLKGEGPMPDSDVLKQHYAKMAEAKEQTAQEIAGDPKQQALVFGNQDINQQGEIVGGMASGGEIDTSEVKGIVTDRGTISVNEQGDESIKVEPNEKKYQNLSNRLYAGNETRQKDAQQNEPDSDRIANEHPKAQMQEIPKAQNKRQIQEPMQSHSNEQRNYSSIEESNSPLSYYKTSMKKAVYQATQNPSHGDLFTRIATNGSKNMI